MRLQIADWGITGGARRERGADETTLLYRAISGKACPELVEGRASFASGAAAVRWSEGVGGVVITREMFFIYSINSC